MFYPQFQYCGFFLIHYYESMDKKDLKEIKIIVENIVDKKQEKLAQITARGFLEVNARIDKLENKFDKLEDKVDKLEDKVDELKVVMEKGIDKMREIADGMAGQFMTWKEENAVGAVIQNRHEEQLNNHELRIIKLEKIK